MITFQSESFKDNLSRLQELFPLHWKELAMNQDKVPLAPAYEMYFEFEKNDGLVLVTMRIDDVIMGYYIGFIMVGLHYTTCLECKMDIFWIHPEARANGLPGLKLFRAVEEELKKRGVQRWLVGTKVKADVTPLFKRLGFAPIEVYHSKWIGE